MSASASGIAVKPLTPRLGAEISGVNLADLDAGTLSVIQEAFDQHGGLLFRGQKLQPADLVAFSRHFGELDHAPVNENGRKAVEDFPEIYVVSNIKGADGKPVGSLGAGEAVWHTDMSYIPNPPYASMLYAVEVPAEGGDTWLCSMAEAYDALPPGLKARVEGLQIKHDGTYNSAGYLREGLVATDNPMESVGQIHPLVTLHPRTGRQSLYLGRRRNAYILGLSLAESEALLDEIWQYAALPENCYSHRWSVGDVLMWDNRATMHRRDPFDQNARRLMQRTQIKGQGMPRGMGGTRNTAAA